ncbi:dTMP kinase [Castellaniella sp.]|uniref:dTMP kinase n=1 Tax=Castellaniella sp. TaxID=1955812 RepID=UPI003C7895F3
MAQQGCFITLEGVDGAGKSTHVAWIAAWLKAQEISLIETREPGGTPVGEHLRELVLHQPMDLRTETLIMFAARNEHWRTVIQPALARGQWVLCDRYTDASFAYQGGGRRLGAPAIAQLEHWVQQGLGPDCTFLFDVPLEIAQKRLQSGRAHADRFEQEDQAFFERTRQAYHERAQAEPGRFVVIDACGSIEDVRRQLTAALQVLVSRRQGRDGTSAGRP